MATGNADLERGFKDDDARTKTGAAKTPFEDFLIAEYSNIAHAHFNITDTISTFFRHYLLIVSLPLPLLGVVFKGSTWTEMVVALRTFAPLIAVGSGFVALVGFCVMCYVSNLRFDAILYARTINGVRQFFYDARSSLSYEAEERVRVLPRSTHRPLYCERWYFQWVVLAFAFINTAYCVVCFSLYCSMVGQLPITYRVLDVVVSSAAFFSLNLCVYCLLARYRENSYLRSHIIGVDIDGVLNCHRPHFCQLLKEVRKKDIDPDAIVCLPVRNHKELGVTEDDEYAVFNHPKYWQTMPACPDAPDRLKKLRNVLGYKVFIFTYRDWPQQRRFPLPEARMYQSLWRSVTPLWRFRGRAIRLITRAWLKEHGVPYDRLLIECGNIDTLDRRMLTRNRLITSRDRQMRLFVEDDLSKAKKLADVCDLVFLINHPYNQTTDALPNNLRRVDSWDELYEYVRKVL